MVITNPNHAVYNPRKKNVILCQLAILLIPYAFPKWWTRGGKTYDNSIVSKDFDHTKGASSHNHGPMVPTVDSYKGWGTLLDYK